MPENSGQKSKGPDAKPESNQISAPTISLPKGGGAIRGMGEKFAANPVTGTGSVTVPIATSPGRSGFGPQLSLSYDSGAGNGPFGLGWNLSLPSITRKTDKGLPKYQDADESDVFILSGAEDLVPVFRQDADGNWVRDAEGNPVMHDDPRTVAGATYRVRRYRPRIEGLFARIERWMNQADPADTFWRSISKDNITTWYGKTAESRVADPDDTTHIFTWLICESYDGKGNVIVYEYQAEDQQNVSPSLHEQNRKVTANRYLKRIKYGNHSPYYPDGPSLQPLLTATDWLFHVVFDYGEHDQNTPHLDDSMSSWPSRLDAFSRYRAGFEVRTYRLCQRVLMFHHFIEELGPEPHLVRSTDFLYSHEEEPSHARDPVYTFLASVTQKGFAKKTDGNGYETQSLPPLEFTYTEVKVDEEVHEVDQASLENLPIGLDGTGYQWIDLDSEGLPGILTEQADAWFYKRNLSSLPVNGNGVPQPVKARFEAMELVATKPSLADLQGGQQLMDLAGEGELCLVQFSRPLPGYYEREEGEWQSFTPFASLPNIEWNNPNLKSIDLNGDGHADILITEDQVFTWYPSRAKEGFGPAETVRKAVDEEKGPALVFADATQSVYLADLSGDGLTDVVRIRNGEVCYWPNLGYGRFGAKITMSNAPVFDYFDQFDQKRIRLADIDGSGTTDIIYVGHDKVTLYFNQSGNAWSAAGKLSQFPAIDNLAAVTVVDLLGNGTACLVWSSPLPGEARRPMRYIDLMGGQKPHLLIKTINNLGAETVVRYAPSTKFYLQDKRDGQPWITKLPFPVHVVERVETYDHISRNHFVARYAYHHGYFDGIEREFRGFGIVEQWDTEAFAALSDSDAFPVGDNVAAESHVPPVHTKTWFHTGVYLGRDHVSDFFAGLLNATDQGEYFREPGLTDGEARALLLPDTVLPPGLTPAEEREACRSLKGAMLRQEVYALDGSSKESLPYTVAEQNFTIQPVQPRDGNRFAVFFTHAREAITYHYERNPLDPRIQHALTLEVDAFGNVLKSAAVGYGRRQADPVLEPRDQEKQTLVPITFGENSVTNQVETADDYRTPLPSKGLSYELTGLTVPVGRTRFTLDDLLVAATNATSIAYEQSPTPGTVQKRIIEHVRTLYRRNDLTGLLTLGQLESLALPGEAYKLVFTPGLLTEVYGGRVTDSMVEGEGRYVHSEGDSQWWIPSGLTFFSPDSEDTPAQELAHARSHFFLPHRMRDPFHTDAVSTESFVSYDAYDLLMVETRDALGNRITVGERDAAGDLDPNRLGNDYRVLQPFRVTDPNGNRVEAAFDTLGMVVGTAVKGKPLPAPVEGDSLDGFEPDLTQPQIEGFYDVADPHVPAPSLLKGATTRIIYDLDRFRRTQQAHPEEPTQWLPVCAATLARETHVSDPLPPDGLKIQISFSYSDGFGREIQKKIQAEPGPVVEGGPVVSPRWVGSGWTIFNNKGKPVRQYEPFFSDTHLFEFGVQVGVSPILFYDPVERVVATLHPNHTYEKVRFDPWQQTTYDVNDTVAANGAETGDPRTDADIQGYTAAYFAGLPASPPAPAWQTWYQERITGDKGPQEKNAAEKSAKHANTPSVAHLDTLGRAFLTIADNRLADGTEQLYETRVELDIEGNQRSVTDALNRKVMAYDYDMLGTKIHQDSVDAGERWMLTDAAGKPMRAWDSRDHQFRTAYDPLQRPTESYVREGAGPDRLVGRTVYGETHPNPDASNQRGKVVQLFDQAGVVTSDDYDFKGSLLSGNRQLLQNYKDPVDWSQSPTLETQTFTSSTTYDALNRPVTLTMPDASVMQPNYNEANLLEQVHVNLQGTATATPFVTDIDYDAKGQRQFIEYGNGTRTEYSYDDQTFRLIKLLTTRTSDNALLQDLSYAYDPVGNITSIRDDAQQTIYFNGQVVSPSTNYEYDSLYRLIRAEGREHAGQASNNVPEHRPELKPHYDFNDSTRKHLPHPNDGQAMRNYAERYEYDEVGNILRMIHQAGANGGWTRGYAYAVDSNQLLATSLPDDPDEGPFSGVYDYDAHGNMVRMPHLTLMQWDDKDQLQATSTQVVSNGGLSETTYYVYDATGQRVRKVTETENGARKDERVYLGGFELYRKYNGNGQTTTLARETLHVMDDKRRIALVETRTQGNDGAPAQLVRYQFDNHLGFASLELDDSGSVISYEEYHPYGTTSYQAGRSAAEVSRKCYRYTGKERDEETGLSYYGARYYVPWLGRWTSCDPEGLGDGLNLYTYVQSNPIVLIDLKERIPTTVEEEEAHQDAAQEATNSIMKKRMREKRQGLKKKSRKTSRSSNL